MASGLVDAYCGRRVLITGHTGFKGAWLSAWLLELGAEVTGYALEPPTEPSIFEQTGLRRRLEHRLGDVREGEGVLELVAEVRPDVVVHMAAQSLVRPSYERPVETFETNVMGTVNVLEGVRRSARPCVVITVTSDKCYENREVKDYRETDPLGGSDPYSASKGAAEIAISAYRGSFFAPDRYGEHGVALASVRAGNVIGGGDWARDRIVPDIMRALYEGRPVEIRNPHAVRPWQYVLDALSGYLWLGARMLSDGAAGFAEAWNFGPVGEDAISVAELADRILRAWGEGSWSHSAEQAAPREAAYLRLCCDKVAHKLDWRPTCDIDAAIEATVDWYRRGRGSEDMYAFTVEQIRAHAEQAGAAGLPWARGSCEEACDR